MKNMNKNFRRIAGVLIPVLLVLAACAGEEKLTSTSTSEFFVQDFNPSHLDILWVVDDRSPMHDASRNLVAEAASFFSRLDSATLNYQMGITTMSSSNAGGLKPSGIILDKKRGTKEQRVQLFSNLLAQVINLRTDADNQGLWTAVRALQTSFIPRTGVPLVLVFMSDGDDFSPTTTGVDAVTFYSQALLNIKGGQADLVKVYAINYLALANGENPIGSAKRCATQDNADIDKTASYYKRTDGTNWFQDRYFRLATQLNGQEADLCSSFSSLISLDGLKLKTLPKAFRLSNNANGASLRVTVTAANGDNVEIAWTYNTATNEIVFQDTPPAGSSIQVTFLTGN